jgi:uracil-DNA glycosylase
MRRSGLSAGIFRATAHNFFVTRIPHVYTPIYIMASLKRKSDIGATDASKKPKTNGSITSFFGPPKTTAPAASATKAAGAGSTSSMASFVNAGSTNPASKFNKEAWVATLTPEQKRYLSLEINTLDPSWLALLKDDIVKPEFIALKKFIEAEVKSGKNIFPPSDDVYSWYARSKITHAYWCSYCFLG